MEYLKIDWRGEGAAGEDDEEAPAAGGPRAAGAASRDLARIRSLMEGTATYPVISAATFWSLVWNCVPVHISHASAVRRTVQLSGSIGAWAR